MIAAIPLVADAGDVLGVIVFLVILIISAISQMVGKAKEAQQAQRPRPPVRPARPAPNPQDPVVRELDEFLRRAAAGGKPQQPQPGQAAPVRPQTAAARPPAPKAPAATRAPAVLVARSVPVEEIEELEEVHLEPTLADRLGQAGEKRLSSQTEQPLGAGVAEAQQRMSHQLSQDFRHQVGQLAGAKQEPSGAAPTSAAAGLAALLASPADLRQAILLNEILQRPEHRWHSAR